MNTPTYVLLRVPDLDEYSMPDESGDRRARLNVGAIKELLAADIVIAIDPNGVGVTLKGLNVVNDSCTWITIDAQPRDKEEN